MEHFKNFIYGILLGIANVIPGVSGGTMAVILNVYDDILYGLSWKHYRKHLPFLAVLGSGALCGILLFSHIMTLLLESYRLPVYYSFMGLILGSIPMIYTRARSDQGRVKNLAAFILAFGLMLFITFINRDAESGSTLAEVGGPALSLYLWLFSVSVVSTIAMILPGISGSLVMLLLGAYTITLEAISSLDLLTLLPIGAGVLTGGYLGIKFVKILLRYYPQALYFGILGLIGGSLFTIYPGRPEGIDGILSLALMVLFGAVAYLFSDKR